MKSQGMSDPQLRARCRLSAVGTEFRRRPNAPPEREPKEEVRVAGAEDEEVEGWQGPGYMIDPFLGDEEKDEPSSQLK